MSIQKLKLGRPRISFIISMVVLIGEDISRETGILSTRKK